MSKIPRLRDEDADVARLLSALDYDAPSGDVTARASARVRETLSTPRPTGRSLSLTSKLVASVPAWIAAGLLGVTLVSRYSTSTQPEPMPSSASSAVPSPPEQPSAPTLAVAATVSVDDLPTASGTGASAPSAKRPSPSASASAPTKSSFREELALVETARMHLDNGDPTSCLSVVTRYERQFRGGVFAQEMELMQIEALALAGENERARSLGQRFLANQSDSPYAERARLVLKKLP